MSTPARYVLPGPDLLLPFSYLSCLSSLSRHLHLAWSGSGAFCWSLSSQFVHPTISRQYSEMLSLTGNLMNGSQSLSCSNNETSILVSFCPSTLTRTQDKIVLNEELIPFDNVARLTYFKKTVTNFKWFWPCIVVNMWK